MRNLIFLLLPLCTGCFRVNYVNSNLPRGLETDKKMHLSLIAGLVELDEEQADSICPGGFRAIEQSEQPVDWLISYLSGSLVVTRTMKFYCNDGSEKTMAVDAKGKVSDLPLPQ